jgi:hypothetical protein
MLIGPAEVIIVDAAKDQYVVAAVDYDKRTGKATPVHILGASNYLSKVVAERTADNINHCKELVH